MTSVAVARYLPTPPPGGRRWTKDEDDVLRRHYGIYGMRKVIARNLHRSPTAVSKRAGELGITRRVPTRERPWTLAERQYIQYNCGRLSPVTMAKKLGRGAATVQAQIKALELQAGNRDGWYTLGDLVAMWGTSWRKLSGWVHSGALKAALHNPDATGPSAKQHIEAKDARAFFIAHVAEFQGRSVDLAGLMALLGVEGEYADTNGPAHDKPNDSAAKPRQGSRRGGRTASA